MTTTQTHLVDRGYGTERVVASSPAEALAIARRCKGDGPWAYVGVVEPRAPRPAYRETDDLPREAVRRTQAYRAYQHEED